MLHHVVYNEEKIQFASKEEVRAACLTGKISPHALYWHKGMGKWEEVEVLMEVKKYQVISDGQPLGTFSEQEIMLLVQQNRLRSENLCWTKGMPDWKALAAVVPHPDMPPLAPTLSSSTKSSNIGFLSLSTKRLILMGLATMGFFSFYWCYRNWKYLKERDQLRIMPFWRSVFTIFFLYNLLFKISHDRELDRCSKHRYSAGWLTAGWIVVTLISNSMARAGVIDVVGFAGLLLSSLAILFLCPPSAALYRQL